MIMPNDKKKIVATTCQDQYFFRWQRNQYAESTLLKLKTELAHTQRLIKQQQQDIEQNKKSIAKSTLSGLREDITRLQKILDKNERICEDAVRKKEVLKDLIDRRQLIAETKIQLNNKNILIKRTLATPDRILPEAKAAQECMPELEKNLERLQKKAVKLEEEIESKKVELKNGINDMFFFQSAFSKKVSTVSNHINSRSKISDLSKQVLVWRACR
jgi:chromosome segregation ATPase